MLAWMWAKQVGVEGSGCQWVKRTSVGVYCAEQTCVVGIINTDIRQITGGGVTFNI